MTRPLLLMAIGLLLPGIVVADECPRDKVIALSPETTLAGIDIARDTMQGVRDRFGKPSKAKWILDEGSAWAKYKWVRGETAVAVSGRASAIEIVQISGDAQGDLTGTSRGLTLGDSVERVEELYGTTYVDGRVNAPEIGDTTRTYCFEDRTELSVGLDDANRVMAIRLTVPADRPK